MGLQEEMFFSKFQQACHTCLCSRPQHTSRQGQIHAVVPNFQCVLDKECTLPGLISVQRLIKPCSSVYDAAILADLSDLHS